MDTVINTRRCGNYHGHSQKTAAKITQIAKGQIDMAAIWLCPAKALDRTEIWTYD
jgi:hypothetical protein